MTAPLRVRVDSFALRLSEPLTTGQGAIRRRDGFILRVERDGTVGLGEASPLTGWTEPPSRCERALASLDVGSPAELKHRLGAMESTPAARHGLQMAWLDLRAREHGRPLYRELGDGGAVDRVEVNGLVGDGPPEATARQVTRLVKEGYRCLKLKVGRRSLEEDLERTRAAHHALPPSGRLRLDANRVWSPQQSIQALEACRAWSLQYLEEPIDGGLNEYRRLAGRGPIALDESLLEHPLDTLLEEESFEYAVLKPMALGGLDRAFEWAQRLREHDRAPVVTTTVDAVVGRCGAAHLAAALGNGPASGLSTATLLRSDLARDPLPVERGSIRLPTDPGIGLRAEELEMSP